MHKAKHGESDKGKDKQKGTLSELNVSPEDVVAAKLNLKWLYTREKTRPRKLSKWTTTAVTASSSGISSRLPIEHILVQDDGNDSIWLFEVLDNIGVNSCYREICREGAISHEILSTCTLINNEAIWSVGSAIEGTSIPGKESDVDAIKCYEHVTVIEDISKAEIKNMNFLIVREPETLAGYVKLQLVLFGVPCMSEQWPSICDRIPSIKPYLTTDKFGCIVLCDILFDNVDACPLFSRAKNKPAAKMENVFGNIDVVMCYQCKTWPTSANEWLTRHRCNGWPTKETIDELILLGFFVVRKGHPCSQEINLEWRISLSLQERKLLFSLTDVQYKCYVILKMLNRDVLRLDCITSYHWKTCLFYMIEENKPLIWKKSLLFDCVDLCIKRMLKWVKHGCCPNYFIPEENLFEGRMTDILRVISENKLEGLLNEGFAILLRVQSYNLCEYYRFREDFERSRKLQAESIKIYTEKVYFLKTELCKIAMNCVNDLFEKIYPIGKKPNVIEILWQTLDHIKYVSTVSKHTSQETKRAFSILLPFVYTCLASNISAIWIQRPYHKIRDFLLFGCYIYFINGNLAGHLKFISVLYALGCFKECKWYLNQLDEEYIKYNPSVCVCKYTNSVMDPMDIEISDISKLQLSTCVVFLPTELPLIPNALKFEVFKYFGISSHSLARDDLR